LKVACFSIYIALLDYQEPKDIDIYQFPDLLDKNLFIANFFNTEHYFDKKIRKEKVNFILGNPPWKSKKDDKIHIKWLKDNEITVGRYEIAQSFLLRVKDFMQPCAKTALIVTSTMFYNTSATTKKFKNKFLTTYCLEKLFDLSAVKQTLFETQESPASILFFRISQNEEYNKNIIKHCCIKVNYFLKKFKILVIEKFDQKEILQRYFIENEWLFKVALYGNSLDYNLIKNTKIKNNQKLIKLIDDKMLFVTSGVLRGNRKNKFSKLQGLSLIENENIKQYYTFEMNNKVTKSDLFLEAGRSINNFNKSKILIKEQAKDWTDLIISYNPQSSVFIKGVFGLSFSNKNHLKLLYSILISDFYKYFIFLISGGWGIATHPQTKWVEEYLSFPFDVDKPAEVWFGNYLLGVIN
jgi:hypothetical protein